MPGRTLKVVLILALSAGVIFFLNFSNNCYLDHVELAPTGVNFDYILIKDSCDLDAVTVIGDRKVTDSITSFINKNNGFVFLTNGYKIVDCYSYKGIMYISSARASPGMVYAAFFKGDLKGPYKFAAPK